MPGGAAPAALAPRAADVRSVFVLLVIAAKQLDAIALIVFWVGGRRRSCSGRQAQAALRADHRRRHARHDRRQLRVRVDRRARSGIPALLLVAALAFALAGLLAIAAPPLTPRSLRPPARARWRAPRRRAGLAAPALAREPALPGARRERAPQRRPRADALLPVPLRRRPGDAGRERRAAAARPVRRLPRLAQRRRARHPAGRDVAALPPLGVPLASTLSPLVYFLGFFGLGVRLDLPAGIGAVVGANLQDHAIYDPAQKMLVTLFPSRFARPRWHRSKGRCAASAARSATC